MTRIALVAALHEELASVLALMPDEHKETIGGRDFWVGHLHGQDVVAVLSGIGKVAAATTATLLIQQFGVNRIVFTGVAGGLGPGVNVGDVVVAQTLLQHDYDVSPIFPRYVIPGHGMSEFPTDMAAFEAARHGRCNGSRRLGQPRRCRQHHQVRTAPTPAAPGPDHQRRPLRLHHLRERDLWLGNCPKPWPWKWRARPSRRCAKTSTCPWPWSAPFQTAPTTKPTSTSPAS